ncbi:hypothetical protein NEUTE1DRAFT_141557 [Neurospora tetrasperma FGSC 2508]|uniref:Uncharacterized protein n=1 Tax=Neurospora tetrasperma (strain FGSC 2508 / ATCC MYA-4615 / P0657) TaxID=510951 RepID=F8N2F2_NEUT8|nr:uncharacterized protein NEUTE1DRAFT_141557 [Neurospora tetrasperma FGSC 2508]EGO51624.1 hypothetical protein NEUTE1DRAFT_141557 [Neurospora tetrasperma FGSC 2508]
MAQGCQHCTTDTCHRYFTVFGDGVVKVRTGTQHHAMPCIRLKDHLGSGNKQPMGRFQDIPI